MRVFKIFKLVPTIEETVRLADSNKIRRESFRQLYNQAVEQQIAHLRMNTTFGKYQKLLRKAGNVRGFNNANNDLITAARTYLQIHVITNNEDEGLPPPEECQHDLRSLLPSLQNFLSREFFLSLFFPIVLLKDIAEFYGIEMVLDNFLAFLQLTDVEKVDKSLSTIIWFAWFLDPTIPSVKHAIDLYKSTKGHANPLMRAPEPASDAIPQQTASPAVSANGYLDHDVNNPAPVTQNSQCVRSLAAPRNDPRPSVHSNINYSLQEPSVPYRKNDSEDTRKINYVQQAIKDSKFKGQLDQCIHTTFKMFDIYSRQYKLSENQKSDILVHAFDGAARAFFLNKTADSMTYDEKKKIMLKEYDNDARQVQVKGKLDSIRLKSFMIENEISDQAEGLTNLVEKIEKLSPQTHPDFRTDRHKIDYLRKAVAEFQSWSKTPIENLTQLSN